MGLSPFIFYPKPLEHTNIYVCICIRCVFSRCSTRSHDELVFSTSSDMKQNEYKMCGSSRSTWNSFQVPGTPILHKLFSLFTGRNFCELGWVNIVHHPFLLVFLSVQEGYTVEFSLLKDE